MKPLSVRLMTVVAALGLVAGFGLLGYRAYPGPNQVVCVDARNNDPFNGSGVASHTFALRSDIPIKPGMTVRDAINQAGFQPVEFEKCGITMARYARWHLDHLELRCLNMVHNFVRLVPADRFDFGGRTGRKGAEASLRDSMSCRILMRLGTRR